MSLVEIKPSLKIEASEITPFHISYKCPFCYSKYKKNGEAYKNAKQIKHSHGFPDWWRDDKNLNTPFHQIDFTKYTNSRSAHCINEGRKEFEKQYDGVEIFITNNTKKIGFKGQDMIYYIKRLKQDKNFIKLHQTSPVLMKFISQPC